MRKAWIVILIIFLISLCLADLLIGVVVPGDAIFYDVLMTIRLPRILTALLVGSALSVSGAQMQSVFRNPLADPHIMGISGGAGLGVAIAVCCSAVSGLTVIGSAFLGAIGSAAIILLVSAKTQKASTLLIFGVMLGFIFAATTAMIEAAANEQRLKTFFSWLSGSFNNTTLPDTGIIAAVSLIAVLLAFLNAKGLDIILFGDEFTRLEGASPKSIRFISILSSCLATGAATAFCGPIGFVGIVSPHLARRVLSTSRHRIVMPAAILIGSILTVGADLMTQLLPFPNPSGSSVAIIGIPIIMVIIIRYKDLG